MTIKEYMYNHLQELMEEVETYGWKVVSDYHAAWLQLMEQGRATRGDTNRKEKLRRLMVWCKPALGAKQAATPGAPAWQQPTTQPQPYRSRYGYIIQPSKPGDKACMSYNQGACHNNTSHPLDFHVCAFCLRTAHKLCKHPETQCKCKEGDKKNGAGGV